MLKQESEGLTQELMSKSSSRIPVPRAAAAGRTILAARRSVVHVQIAPHFNPSHHSSTFSESSAPVVGEAEGIAENDPAAE